MLHAPRDPAPTPSAIESAYGAEAVNRSSVAALAFIVYDIFITLDQEVNLIWSRPWTYMKCLYFFVRYFPALVQISIIPIGNPDLSPHFHFKAHDCYIWNVYQGVATLTIFMAVDFILILRIYALYHNNAIVRVTVLVSFLLEVAAMCIGLGLSIPGIRFDDICLVTGISSALLIYAGASILFQAFLFSLTVIKFVSALRDGWGNTPLLTLLARDGTWAFFTLFIVTVSDASLYGLKNHAYSGVIYGWLLTAFSFSGYRILLNLNHLHDSDTRRTAATSTDIEFTTRMASELLHPSYEMSPLSSTAVTSTNHPQS